MKHYIYIQQIHIHNMHIYILYIYYIKLQIYIYSKQEPALSDTSGHHAHCHRRIRV